MGPYGITQVDVPGILQAREAMQQNRIRALLLQKQMDAEDRKAETEKGVRSALSQFTKGGISETGATQSGATAPQTASGMSAAVGAYSGAPADPLAALPEQAAAPASAVVPARTGPTPADRERLFAELMALDPEAATQVMTAFQKMDEATATAAKNRNEVLGRAAQHLLAIPAPQRAAELQRIAPVLIADGGITQEQLSGFDPSNDRQLQFIVGQSRDIEKIIEASQPKIMTVPQGGQIAAVDPRTGEATVTYETPTVEGPGGEVYARPPAMSGMKPPQIRDAKDYEALPPGTTYIDPNGVQRTKGGQTGSAPSGGFPGN